MHRRVFNDVGGFDEGYPAGAEEIDFARRAADAGYTPVFVPDALIHYRIRSDLRGVMRQQYNSGQGAACLYARFRPPEAVLRSRLGWGRRTFWFLRLYPLLSGPGLALTGGGRLRLSRWAKSWVPGVRGAPVPSGARSPELVRLSSVGRFGLGSIGRAGRIIATQERGASCRRATRILLIHWRHPRNPEFVPGSPP